MTIKKAAVIGSGVMGSGIAAHIANAGVPVILLDIVPKDAGDNRDMLADGALRRMARQEPAPFMHKRAMKLVSTGNIEDDLDRLADRDWIVEAVVEDPAIKLDLYGKLDKVRKKGSIVSSNTSTIPLAKLTDGMPGAFKADFLITHFFNPPRYMRLLEIVGGPDTRPDALETIRDFGDRRLGKGVVNCKDTPGFIANRIGNYWVPVAIGEAVAMGLTVEEADAVMGRPVGIPKTGVFGLLDLVGIDIVPLVMKSMTSLLPKGDSYHRYAKPIPAIDNMLKDGYTGRKGKGGFYRVNRDGGGKAKESIDLDTGEFAPTRKARLDSVKAAKAGLRALVEHEDKGGRYARKVLIEVLGYAATVAEEIADDIVSVDDGMKLGYAWKRGPFEMIDELGAAWLAERMAESNIPVPELLTRVGDGTFYRVENGVRRYFAYDGKYVDVARPDGVLLLSDVKRRSEPLIENGSASLWDIGDGAVCLEFHTKMNSLDEAVFELLGKALKFIPRNGYKAMVIHNEGSNFSVGANIGLALFAANVALWPAVEDMVAKGQKGYKALKYAPFPVVGAPSGMALGGGCEVLLHCDALQAHAETYTGLVEIGVGIVPGWGGCKEMITRWMTDRKRPGGPMPAVSKVFELIGTAQVAKSAAEARDFLILREQDGITMNRDRVLADAKARALQMAKDYRRPEPVEISLPGPAAKSAMRMAVDGFARSGKATPHDVAVSEKLADVLSGGDTDITDVITEDELLTLERAAFMALLKTPATLDRMEHMLTTGKPLRN